MNNSRILKHYGVRGMKWGVRKERVNTGRSRVDQNTQTKEVDFKREGFVIKKGTVLNRTSTTANETHSGSTYASFLNKDAQSYKNVATVFSKVGMQHYNMTFEATRDLVSPSKEKRVEVFLKKMEDPVFKEKFEAFNKKMYIYRLPTPQDYKMSKEFEGIPFKKIKAYRALNQAISGNKELRQMYLDEFKKLHYDFILDEADANNKVSTAPVILLERADSLSLLNVDKL